MSFWKFGESVKKAIYCSVMFSVLFTGVFGKALKVHARGPLGY